VHFIVLADSDIRAVRLTVQSLGKLVEHGASVSLVLRQNALSRFNPRDIDTLLLPAGLNAVWLPSHGSLHRSARDIALKSGDELTVMVREGIVLAPQTMAALADELGGAGSTNSLILSLSRNRSINQLSDDELRSDDPWKLLRRPLDADPDSLILQARCLRPCIFAVRTAYLSSGDFERFSSLPDWYAYHLFVRNASNNTDLINRISADVGFVGAYPDRRKPSEQGACLARRLYKIRRGYPMFSEDVSRDFRTLVDVQLRNVLRPAHMVQATAFLKGLVGESFRESRMQDKLFVDNLN
jgi:hypothetical protein